MAASVPVVRMGQIHIRKSHLVYIALLTLFLTLSIYFVLPAPSVRVKTIVKSDGGDLRGISRLTRIAELTPSSHVNMTHLQMLQEKVKDLAALLKEKSVQLKSKILPARDVGLIHVFQTKNKISETLPAKVWNISEDAVKKLIADEKYFLLLQEAVNKTREISLKYKPLFDLTAGTCNCLYTYCECCARVFAKRLTVDHKMCVNFTYAAGKQGFLVKIDINDVPSFNRTVSAQDTPEICLGGRTEICTQFLNVTYSVKPSESHKTKLAGCLEYHLNVVNKTIASYPVGCFHTDTKNDKGHFIKYLMNWVM